MNNEDLRQKIKNHLESEIENKKSFANSTIEDDFFALEQERKKIFLEERDSVYSKQKGFIKIINEIGEEEWVKEENLKKREGYLNFEDDLEDADFHKKRVVKRTLFYLIIAVSLFGFLFYYCFEKNGYIEVNANATGIPILLNGEPTGLSTDNVLENIRPGKYTISLRYDQSRVKPETQEVEVVKGEGVRISFAVDTLNIDSTTQKMNLTPPK